MHKTIVAHSSSESVVYLIMQYINENGAVNDSLHPQLAELLFSLCTTYAQENFYNAELSPSIETILVSQNRLIEGIAQLLEQSDILSIGSVQSDFALAETLLDDKNIQNRLNTISLILWTTSCILWRNLDTGATKFATIQLCSEHSPKMINHLISLSLSLMNTSQGKIDREENLLLTTCKRLKKAACWLLCVFVRVTPQIINQIFEFYAQNQIDNAHPQEPEFVPDVLYSLGQICQSTKAVSQLRSNGYLDRWVQRATELCRNAFLKPDEFKFDELVAIIDCLKNLCSIYEVCTFLEEYSGSNLIQTLLHLIVDENFNKPKSGTSKSLLTNIQLIQLQISVIKLIKKCLSIGGKHRILVAQILCDLLYQSEDLDSNHSLLLMIHQLVLDDEQITVQFTKVRSISVNNEKRELGQMAHPIFGCCQTSVTCELSIHTPFRELCPKFVDARKSKGQEKALQNKRFMTPWANYSQAEATDNSWLDAPWMHIEGYYKMIKRRSNKRQTENSDSSPKTRLFCEAYSRYKCLQKDYSIATLIQKLLGTSGNPFKGGFMFLQLTLRACGADKTDIVLTSSSPSKEVPKSQLSTLEHFASVGGLLELSKRYYIYHHALTRLFNSCDILTQDLSRISKGVRTGLQLFKANKTNYLTQQTNLYQSLLENINNTAPNPQQTFVSDGNTVCLTYPTMNSNLIEVDQPANFVGSLELFQDNPDSYGVSITDPVPYYGQNSTTNFTTGLSPKSSTTALSFDGSHIIPLFGLFLRLDSYAELMIQTDRLKAKKLLCMALDIKPIEHSMSEFLANLCPMDIKEKAPQEASSTDPSAKYRNFPSVLRNYNEVSNSEAADDAEELTLFPLIILKCLYEKYSPSKIGLEKAISIRQNSVEYGIVDSLIVCLNHFTHNDGAVDQSKTENAETTIQLIGEVLKASERLEQLRVSLAQLQQTKVEQDSLMAEMPIPTTNFSANASAVTTATSQVGNQTSKSSTTQTKSSGEWGKPTAAASSTATTQESTFWAKGTGFGSGSTQQQWNVNEHLSRRRQNENHIAHLLNVLSAYIRPDLNVQKERPPQVSSPLLPFVSEESIVPSTSGLTSSSSEEKGEGGNQGAAEIDENIVLSENFVHLLQHSCTCKIVQSYLVNDSVLDISKHVVVFDAIISFIAALARTPDIKIKKNREVNAVDMSTPETGQSPPLAEQAQTQIDVLGTLLTPSCDDQHQIDLSQRRKAIVDLLEKLTTLRKNIQIYLNKIEKSKPSPSFTSSKKRRDKKRHIQFDIDILEKTENSFASTSQSLPSPSDSGVNEDEGLDKLLWLIIDACEAIQKKVDLFEVPLDHSKGANNVPIAHSSLSEAIASRENSYCGAMKPLQFETLPFYEENGTKLDVSYHYSSMLASAGSAASSHKRTRRLAQEIVSLNSSLPLSLSSSVFIRASEERLDAMKVLITGPSDTPYANGCFEFDIYFPADYPNTPMLVNLETTGNRSVRFNPNLYDDGKVCLSILNTWRGRPEERWNSETSSLLQVIVSIQSLILVNDPYFNEPGYERWRNTPNGQQASREYDANIRQMCVRWAMIETLKHPPKTFAEVVQRHFWLKRDEICEQIEGWIEETQSYITNKVSSSKTLPAYLAGLKKQYELLKEEFANMQCPKGIMPDHFISTRFPLPNLPDTGKLEDAHQIDGDKNE